MFYSSLTFSFHAVRDDSTPPSPPDIALKFLQYLQPESAAAIGKIYLTNGTEEPFCRHSFADEAVSENEVMVLGRRLQVVQQMVVKMRALARECEVTVKVQFEWCGGGWGEKFLAIFELDEDGELGWQRSLEEIEEACDEFEAKDQVRMVIFCRWIKELVMRVRDGKFGRGS